MALTGDWLIAGVELGLHGPQGIITLRVRGQPLRREGLAQDAVAHRDRLAELPHEVLLRGQQHCIPGADVQLSGRAPVLLGENASGKTCVERVQVRPMEEKLKGKRKHMCPQVSQAPAGQVGAQASVE